MSEILLEMKDLTTSFKTSEGKVTAVHHVDMTIKRGKFWVLLANLVAVRV